MEAPSRRGNRVRKDQKDINLTIKGRLFLKDQISLKVLSIVSSKKTAVTMEPISPKNPSAVALSVNWVR